MPFADELLGREQAAALTRSIAGALGRRPESLTTAESALAPLGRVS